MNKKKIKNLFIFLIPMSILFGITLGSLLGTKEELKNNQEELNFTKELIHEIKNESYMIDMYNEREFYMNEEEL